MPLLVSYRYYHSYATKKFSLYYSPCSWSETTLGTLVSGPFEKLENTKHITYNAKGKRETVVNIYNINYMHFIPFIKDVAAFQPTKTSFELDGN